MVLQIQINRLWNITACHTYSVSLELKEYLGAGSLATILFYNGQCLLRLYQREYMIQRRIWHDLCSSSHHTYYVGEVWARLDQWTGIHVLHMIRTGACFQFHIWPRYWFKVNSPKDCKLNVSQTVSKEGK